MSSRKAPAQQEIDEEYLRSLMAAPEPAASSSDTEVSEPVSYTHLTLPTIA